MDTFTLEPDTLAAIQHLTDDPAEFVRQAVTERLTRMTAGDFSEEEVAELAKLDWDTLLDAQEKRAGSS